MASTLLVVCADSIVRNADRGISRRPPFATDLCRRENLRLLTVLEEVETLSRKASGYRFQVFLLMPVAFTHIEFALSAKRSNLPQPERVRRRFLPVGNPGRFVFWKGLKSVPTGVWDQDFVVARVDTAGDNPSSSCDSEASVRRTRRASHGRYTETGAPLSKEVSTPSLASMH